MNVLDWLAGLDWSAIVQIIALDILMGGDNAILIALACRNLPPDLKKKGIFWGVAGAIILRVILVMFAVQLLKWPFLKFVGGATLIWIGVKLLLPSDVDHEAAPASDRLWTAVKTILVADVVMSVDNVLAIAAAAQQAQPGHQLGLVVFGLLVSIPLIVWGSQIVLKLLERLPIVMWIGGALIGWIGGRLMVDDPIVLPYVATYKSAADLVAGIAGIVLVLGLAKLLGMRVSARVG